MLRQQMPEGGIYAMELRTGVLVDKRQAGEAPAASAAVQAKGHSAW